jgi:hypothetical protein
MGLTRTNHIFGAPHQFTPTVDPRDSNVSSTMGINFCQKILNDAPICTIIPGEPDYLPSVDGDENSLAASFAMADVVANTISSGQGASTIRQIVSDDGNLTNKEVRLYDFKQAYTRYMVYVTKLCNAGAILLGIDGVEYCGSTLGSLNWNKVDMGSGRSVGGSGFMSWFQNRIFDPFMDNVTGSWNAIHRTFFGGSDDDSDGSEKDVSKFVQFYVDPDTQYSESMQNTTADSAIKSAFESGQNFIKEFSFLANSGGLGDISDKLEDFTAGVADKLSSGIASITSNSNGVLGQVGTCLSRILNLSSNIIRGENLILPQIWQSSSYSKSYSITVHLKSPYGSKLAYYLNIFVPLMHLICLALPRQAEGHGDNNTYGAPFLVKATVDGEFSCNMGIVESITISRASDSWSAEGLPCEVDVSLNIVDLYSQLVLSDDPRLFRGNASLIEYLAVNTGLSVIKPNITKKLTMFMNDAKNDIVNTPNTIASSWTETIDEKLMKWARIMN